MTQTTAIAAKPTSCAAAPGGRQPPSLPSLMAARAENTRSLLVDKSARTDTGGDVKWIRVHAEPTQESIALETICGRKIHTILSTLLLPMNVLPRNLLHGSPSKAVAKLSPTHGKDSSPFGPALYLTEDPAVASCYVKGRGAIYVVELAGNHALTIPMNAPWKELSVDARLAITKLFKAINAPVPLGAKDARATLDGVLSAIDKRQRNEFLAAEGIWMLYGYIDPTEDSGLCDRGVQYALLSESAMDSQYMYGI